MKTLRWLINIFLIVTFLLSSCTTPLTPTATPEATIETDSISEDTLYIEQRGTWVVPLELLGFSILQQRGRAEDVELIFFAMEHDNPIAEGLVNLWVYNYATYNPNSSIILLWEGAQAQVSVLSDLSDIRETNNVMWDPIELPNFSMYGWDSLIAHSQQLVAMEQLNVEEALNMSRIRDHSLIETLTWAKTQADVIIVFSGAGHWEDRPTNIGIELPSELLSQEVVRINVYNNFDSFVIFRSPSSVFYLRFQE